MITAARVHLDEYLPARSYRSANSAIVSAGLDPARHLRQETRGVAFPLIGARELLQQISLLGDDWDGFGSVGPSSVEISRAQAFVEAAFNEINGTNFRWTAPNITASESGAIVFEWWHRARKLTVYVTTDAPEYLKVWGPDITNNMEDGQVTSEGQFRDLWSWLHS